MAHIAHAVSFLSLLLAFAGSRTAQAQVSAYTFSQSIGTWQPISGNGTPLGMPGLPPPFTFDDNAFVVQGESLPLGSATTGNGWPIGFTFNFNGQSFDRVGLSMEGWLTFGNSSNGINAVHVPVGSAAYTPVSSPITTGVDATRRNRVAAFAMDLAAMGGGGTWPIQIRTTGVAPNRTFTAEWNVVRSGGSNLMSFQIRLNEAGGDPAAQTVQVIYGGMTQSTALNGQVGLAGLDPSDFNNRQVATAPFNWSASEPGASNTATCRPPAQAANLPQGLTYTWTPPGCRVNGVSVSGLLNQGGSVSGLLSWSALAGAVSYDYQITTGGPSDPVVLSGTGITGTSVLLEDLPADGSFFAYVQADCGAGDAGWGSGHPFTTEGIIQVVCGQAPMEFTHCYADLEERTWHFTGTANEPLRLIIHSGDVFNGDVLVLYDGPTVQSPVLFTSTSGAVAGQIINSTGPQLTMELIADDIGSCAVQEFITPLEWEVGCVDCDPVLASYQVVDDCAQGEFSVIAQIFSMGSANTVSIINDAGAASIVANAVGQYTVGPFSNGTPVVITGQHPLNTYCSSISPTLLNGTCPVVGCGPDTYTYCYENNELQQWAYSGSLPDDRIGIRFTSGSLAAGDIINVFDGLDEFTSPVLGVIGAGELAGDLFTSSPTSNTIMLQLITNASGSCESGNALPLTYIVGCYDGCVGPEAVFEVEDDCALGQFSVVVDISTIGSAGEAVISNNVNSATATVVEPGVYTVGPFAIGSSVVVNLEGSDPLCSLNSIALSDGCGVGMVEIPQERLRIYPDPGDGAFELQLPHGFGGGLEIEVLDLAGRRVQLVRSNGPEGVVIPLDLTGVPAGSYVVVMRDQERVVSGTVRVVR